MSDRRLLLALCFAGCADGAPPLDALNLRDALTADPEVIAALPSSARRALADRLEAARAAEPSSEEFPVGSDGTAPATASRVDRLREQRGRDAVMVASYEPAGARLFVHPVPDAVDQRSDGAPVIVPGASALEAAALDGKAGAIVAALLAASGAHHTERVAGWPVGAVAIGDTVYVNGAWLAALAPSENGDGGVAPTASSTAIARTPARRVIAVAPLPVAHQDEVADAPDSPLAPSDNPPSSSGIPTAPQGAKKSSSAGDACDAAGSAADGCDACGSLGDACDGCDSSDTDCSGCDASGAGDCGGGDCGGGGDCSVGSRHHGRARGTKLMMLLAPLLYLLRSRRKKS